MFVKISRRQTEHGRTVAREDGTQTMMAAVGPTVRSDYQISD